MRVAGRGGSDHLDWEFVVIFVVVRTEQFNLNLNVYTGLQS